MSSKSEIEEKLEKSLQLTKCPHCNITNPVIRVVRAYQSPCGWVLIFSCAACHHIISCGLDKDETP